jgi:hypothetical protein
LMIASYQIFYKQKFINDKWGKNIFRFICLIQFVLVCFFHV